MGNFLETLYEGATNLLGSAVSGVTGGILSKEIVKGALGSVLGISSAEITEEHAKKVQMDVELKKKYESKINDMAFEQVKLHANDTQSARDMYAKKSDMADKIAMRIMTWNLTFISILVAVNVMATIWLDVALVGVICSVIGTVIGALIAERSSVVNFFFSKGIPTVKEIKEGK